MRSAARRPLVVGNWKLHKSLSESRALAQGVVEATAKLEAEKVREQAQNLE